MSAAKCLALSLMIVFGVAEATKATVVYPVEGLWTVSDNVYRFRVTSNIGPIRGLDIRFAAAAGSQFQTDFEHLFDADGTFLGQRDTFFLFPSPGIAAFQEKTASSFQAQIVGITTFTTKNIAQFVFDGPPALPKLSGVHIPSPVPCRTNFRRSIFGDRSADHKRWFQSVATARTAGVRYSDRSESIRACRFAIVGKDGSTPASGLIWSDLAVGGPGKDPAFPRERPVAQRRTASLAGTPSDGGAVSTNSTPRSPTAAAAT